MKLLAGELARERFNNVPLPSALSVPTGSHASSLSVEHARDVWIQMKAYVLQGARHTEGTHRPLALGTTLHGPTVTLFSCSCGSPWPPSLILPGASRPFQPPLASWLAHAH